MGTVTERASGEVRDNKVEERRKQILDAAGTVIAQKGYHGTTMDDIVKESKLSKGTLYWYFNSKKEIILALMDRALFSAQAMIDRILADKNTFAEQLQAIMDHSSDMDECDPSSDDNRVREMLLNTEFWRQAIIDPEVNAKLTETYQWQTSLGEKLVGDAIARGEIIEIDATALSDVIIAVMDGISLRWLLNPKGMNLERAAHTFLKVFLKGLKPSA